MEKEEKKWEFEVVSRVSAHYLILKKGENVRGSIRIDDEEKELWGRVQEFLNEQEKK